MGLWRERVGWWEREFDLSPAPPPAEKVLEGTGMGGGGFGAATGAARREQAPAASAPRGDAAEYDRADDAEMEAPPLMGSPAKKKAKDSGGDEGPAPPSIALKAWDPSTPYLAALKAAASSERTAVYLAQRDAWGTAPAFFLDCADWFAGIGERATALRVLSNLVELDLEDPALLRVFARRLVQIGELDLAIQTFERIAELRRDEPQSHRDLALALSARADSRAPAQRAAALTDFQAALDALATVVLDEWERFAEIELIALVEFNEILPRAQALGTIRVPLDPRLIEPLDMDVRIVMSWDADMTDMDLHVREPSGEEAYYGHNRTRIGGRVSRDFTQGYGPEEYSIRRAMNGEYEVRTKFFGSSAAQLQGAVTLTIDLYTDYGRPTQQHQAITIRLTDSKEEFTVASIRFDGPKPRPVTR